MTPDQIAALVVSVVGGGVLGWAYWRLARAAPAGSTYLTSPLWLGWPRGAVIALVVLQALAAAGFLAAVLTWIFGAPPDGGVMARPAALPVTLAVFLLGSIAWAVLVARPAPGAGVTAGVSLALVATAAATVALIAGAAEEKRPRWWVLLGLLLLGAVTVLADGVAWNARWIATRVY